MQAPFDSRFHVGWGEDSNCIEGVGFDFAAGFIRLRLRLAFGMLLRSLHAGSYEILQSLPSVDTGAVRLVSRPMLMKSPSSKHRKSWTGRVDAATPLQTAMHSHFSYTGLYRCVSFPGLRVFAEIVIPVRPTVYSHHI